MATAKTLISKAASQIGVKESPAGSNKVKYWDYYKEHAKVNYNGLAWCAAFVAWCMCQVSLWTMKKDEGRFRSCPQLVNWAKANGLWVDRSKPAKAGDQVVFAKKGLACHVGFVEKVLPDGRLQTIEGNTSVTSNDNGGAVMRRTRELETPGSSWYVLGYVRPKFSSSTSATSQGVTVELQPMSQKPATASATATAATTSASKSPFSGGGKYRILRSTLNIYDGYGSKKKKVGQYKKGSTVILDNWSKTGTVYVYGRYIGATSGKKRYIRIGTKNGKKVFAKKV